ncbi:MAG: hypothetical protein ABSF14_21960 [Terriglobia bacterium]|jgi:hypothetical protein
MAIICSQTATISGIDSVICGKLVRVYDILPIYSTIDVLIEGQISPQVGSAGNAFTIGSERYQIILVSKNVSAGTAVVTLTISTVEVPPPIVSVPTHMVQLKLAPTPYVSQIRDNILAISEKLGEYIPSDPNVKYINTELDSSNQYINVYLAWTGPVGMSLGYTRDYSLSRGSAGIYSMGIYSMGILDDISNFIKVYLIPGIIMALGVVIAAIILTISAVPVAIASAVVVVASFFVTGWIVHDIEVKAVVAQAVIDNQDAFIQAIAARDALKKAADDVFAKSAKTNDDCVALASGYKAADEAYVATLKKVLPKVQLDAALANYKGISDGVVADLKAGKISCDTAIANLSPASNALYVASNTEFGTKYSPTATNDAAGSKCPTDCFICDPLAPGTCIVSKNTALVVGIGAIGFIYLVSRPKETVIKSIYERPSSMYAGGEREIGRFGSMGG